MVGNTLGLLTVFALCEPNFNAILFAWLGFVPVVAYLGLGRVSAAPCVGGSRRQGPLGAHRR